MANTEKAHYIINSLKNEMIISERNIIEAIKGNGGSLIGGERNISIPKRRSEIYNNIDNEKLLFEEILRPKDIVNLKIKQEMPSFLVDFIRNLKRIAGV